MSIKSAKYIKNFRVEDGKEVILEPFAIAVNYQNDSNWDVPINSDNTDYQAILEWVAEGNTIADAD
jgi:hypothetical protein